MRGMLFYSMTIYISATWAKIASNHCDSVSGSYEITLSCSDIYIMLDTSVVYI